MPYIQYIYFSQRSIPSNWELINKIRFRDAALHCTASFFTESREGGWGEVLLLWNFQHWQHRFSMLGACGMHPSALGEGRGGQASFDTPPHLTFKRSPTPRPSAGGLKEGPSFNSWKVAGHGDILAASLILIASQVEEKNSQWMLKKVHGEYVPHAMSQ